MMFTVKYLSMYLHIVLVSQCIPHQTSNGAATKRSTIQCNVMQTKIYKVREID